MKTNRYTQAMLTVIAISLSVIAVDQIKDAEARKRTHKVLPLTGSMKKAVYIECNTLKGGELPHPLSKEGQSIIYTEVAAACDLTFYNKGARYTIVPFDNGMHITREHRNDRKKLYKVTTGTPYSKPKPKSRNRNK